MAGMLFAIVTSACSKDHSVLPERRTASTHPMQYYVSLPRGWSKARTWPVVVSIAGSGKEWLDNAREFAAERDAHGYPFIVVTPVVLSNGGRDLRQMSQYTYADSVWERAAREKRCVFDLDGLQAVIADVATLYNGERTFFLTGWSGGGHTANAVVYLHPEWLRGAGLSAANFGGRCITGWSDGGPFDDTAVRPASSTPERVRLPVRYFNGTQDQFAKFLLPQRDSVMKLAAAMGFQNVSSEMVAGMPHSPMPDRVLAYFSSLLSGAERAP
jgi:poly(3-hydroxybutyrate) depolymerase